MDTRFTEIDWDQYAIDYDSLNALHPYREMLGEACVALRDAEYPFLEAGCGTGNLTELIAGRGLVTAVDRSPAMLRRAQEKCLHTQATFGEMDLSAQLSLDTAAFGAVVSTNVLYTLPDPAFTLGEFSRVLWPGGSLVIVTPQKGYDNGLILKSHCNSHKPDSYWANIHAMSAEQQRQRIEEAIPDPQTCDQIAFVGEINARIAAEQRFHFFTQEELRVLVEESGFCIENSGLTYANQNLLIIARRRA